MRARNVVSQLDNPRLFCNSCASLGRWSLRIAGGPLLMSAFDVVAPRFDSFRALPAGVPEAIRAAILKPVGPSPRLLDLGAGSGRIGAPFVAAGDNYVGIDSSSGMLREFAARTAAHGVGSPRLVQADGQQLPLRDAAFDVAMLIQIFGGLRGWRRVVGEARRVLRPGGMIVIGRTAMPAAGIDARMKQRLAAILSALGVPGDRENTREDVEDWLRSNAKSHQQVTAAAWTASRTPRAFIERHRGGRLFSALPAPVRDRAMNELGDWSNGEFGSLDARFSESHAFELQVFQFQHGKH